MKLCAISVDLDEISYYHEIYGLPAPAGPSAHAIFDVGLARLADFALAEEVPMTWFVIGATLARPEAVERLQPLAARGHEFGNHTLTHNYRFTRLATDVIEREVAGAQEAIEKAVGQRPTGFRAPGYTVTDELLELLERQGFAYDSSVFPCPAYYGAKALAISIVALGGRRSNSVVDTPNVLKASTRPYRVGRPYWQKGAGLLELPIQVTRGARLPYIGTTVCPGGPRMSRLLTRMVLGEPFINLELHGIDALDVHDGLAEVGTHARDLHVPHARKLDALAAVVRLLRAEGYAFVRLDEAAKRIQAEGC